MRAHVQTLLLPRPRASVRPMRHLGVAASHQTDRDPPPPHAAIAVSRSARQDEATTLARSERMAATCSHSTALPSSPRLSQARGGPSRLQLSAQPARAAPTARTGQQADSAESEPLLARMPHRVDSADSHWEQGETMPQGGERGRPIVCPPCQEDVSGRVLIVYPPHPGPA